MFRAILAKIPALAPIVTLTLAAILFTLAAPAYADGHHDKEGPFFFDERGNTQLHELAHLYDSDNPAAKLARVQDLLSRGANPNVINHYGGTPLSIAVATNFVKMASLLIVNGAFINVTNIYGQTAMDTAMDLAFYIDNTQMQALLRAHGGKCNKKC